MYRQYAVEFHGIHWAPNGGNFVTAAAAGRSSTACHADKARQQASEENGAAELRAHISSREKVPESILEYTAEPSATPSMPAGSPALAPRSPMSLSQFRTNSEIFGHAILIEDLTGCRSH